MNFDNVVWVPALLPEDVYDLPNFTSVSEYYYDGYDYRQYGAPDLVTAISLCLGLYRRPIQHQVHHGRGTSNGGWHRAQPRAKDAAQ